MLELQPLYLKKTAQILLSDRDRHVIAFGADGLGATSSTAKGDGVQDPMLIRFSDQENPIDWYPTDTNTAGDLRIDTGSKIMQAVETRQQILVFTDVAIYAMQFIGPPFTFGINLISSNISIASTRAAVAVDDAVYWMALQSFTGTQVLFNVYLVLYEIMFLMILILHKQTKL